MKSSEDFGHPTSTMTNYSMWLLNYISMRFFKPYHWLEAKESIDLGTCAEPWNPPFKGSNVVWFQNATMFFFAFFSVSYKTYIYFHIFDQITSSLLEFSFDHQWNYSLQVFLAAVMGGHVPSMKVTFWLSIMVLK